MTHEGRKQQPLDELIKKTEEVFWARVLYNAMAHQITQQRDVGDEKPVQARLWEEILFRADAGKWKDSLLIQIYFVLYKLVVDSSNSSA